MSNNISTKKTLCLDMDDELEDEHQFELTITNIAIKLKYQQAILASKSTPTPICSSMSNICARPDDYKKSSSIKVGM